MGRPKKPLPFEHKDRFLFMGYKTSRCLIWRVMQHQVAFGSVSPASLKDHIKQYARSQRSIVRRAIKTSKGMKLWLS